MAYSPCPCGTACQSACHVSGTASASCTTACDGPCIGNCHQSCSGCTGCSSCDGCSGGCTSCTGCSGCTNTCKGACNSGCKDGAIKDVAARLTQLGLHEYIEAANVQDILDLTYYEAVTRRGKTGYTGTITQFTQDVIEEYFNYAQDNLKNAGQTLSYINKSDGTKYNKNNEVVLKAMGEELVKKALASYALVVGKP